MIIYLQALKKFFVFKGREGRKVFWTFFLVNCILACVALFFDNVLGITFEYFGAYKNIGIGPLFIIFVVVMLIPSLAVSARRLHDIGQSGWMTMLVWFPLIGWIWILIFWMTEGNSYGNYYGLVPKDLVK